MAQARFRLFVQLLLAVGVVCAIFPPAVAGQATQAFGAEADAFVASASPGASFGSAALVEVDGSPLQEGFVRFQVAGVSGPVRQAKLRLFVTNGSSNGPDLYPTSGGWSESSLTWSNQPAATGPVAANAGALSTGAWAEFDVTSLVSGNGSYNFDLVAESSDGVDFVSRESSSTNKPQLLVTSDPPGAGPETTIDSGPSGTTASTSASFSFSSPGPATGFECRIDGSLWAACSSPKTYVGLTPGGHTFEVRAVAAGGAADPTPATRSWTVGSPGTSQTFAAEADAYVASASPGTSYGSAAVVKVDSSPLTEGFVRFRVAGVSGPVSGAKLRLFVSNGSPNGPALYPTSSGWSESSLTWSNQPAATGPVAANVGGLSMGAWAEYDVKSLVSGDGSYSFDLVAESGDGVDFVSRQSSSTNKPQLVVTSAPAAAGPETMIDSGPSGTVASTTASFGFSSSDPAAGFDCRLDGSAWEACSSPRQYSTLGQGSHSFEVRAVGADGAVDQTPAARSWTVDTNPPAVPTGLTAAAGDGRVGLDWADNPGADTAGYRVYRQNSDGSWPATPTATVTASTHTDTGLSNATTYTYRVAAVDGAGNESAPSATASATPTPAPPSSSDPVVMAAGDYIGCSGGCGSSNAAKVRDVMRDQNPDAILGLGDFQYSFGSVSALLSGFDTVFGPKPGGLWPKFRPSAAPTHDVRSGTDTGDFKSYWEREPFKGYSFDLGNWHLVSLPSAAYRYGVDTAGLLSWLNADLSANTKPCTLAFWHEPYWSSPSTGHTRVTYVRPWVQALYDHNAELILSGHQHNYERFAPQSPSDQADPARGIRAIVAGTGGIGQYTFTGTAANSQARNDTTFGAVRLELHPNGYDFRFIPIAGSIFTDSGSGTCH